MPAALTKEEKLEIDRAECVYVVTDKDRKEPGFLDHLERYLYAAQYLPRGARTLEAGCGSGYGSVVLSGVVGELVAVDANPAAVAWATKQYPAKNVSFKVVDLEKPIPFPDASFDAIVSIEVIEHLHSGDDFIREAARVLKPGGIFIISTPNGEVTEKFSGALMRTFNHFHFHEFHPQEFIDALAAHGFAVEKFCGDIKRMDVPKSLSALKSGLAFIDVWNLRNRIGWIRHSAAKNAFGTVEQHAIVKEIPIEEALDYHGMLVVARKEI